MHDSNDPLPPSASDAIEGDQSKPVALTRHARFVGLCVFFFVCVVTLARLPAATSKPTLDMSFREAYEYFWKTGAQAGVDYIFTYGPMGHFLVSRFDRELFYFDHFVILFVTACAAIPLTLMAARQRKWVQAVALLALIVCLVPWGGPESGYVLAAGSATLLMLREREKPRSAYAS